MNNFNSDALKLENQLCFPLYAASKEVIRRYRPYLDALDLTYTQYIAMMVLWEKRSINVKELGSLLYLDSGTLTPMLKSMEAKNLINRTRSKNDERVVLVTITTKGENLKKAAMQIPLKMSGCINLSPDEAIQLYSLLYKILE
ncbi:MAG: MarR family transcriptional regulator [Clostridia bacterium]|nr:MarR family transcriptional regulator [Clostridia bacterium]